MPNPNVPVHAPIKPNVKTADPVDPATQSLTVSVQLTTTADQLNTILTGLTGFIPFSVNALTVDVTVDSGAARAGE